MSRNNVFKLSGNMALGSNDQYGNSDLGEIKQSLKLLKSRKNQNQNSSVPEQNYGYGGSYSSNLPQRNQNYGRNGPSYDKGDYEMKAKNHIPSSYQDNGYGGYQSKQYGDNKAKQYSGYKDSLNNQAQQQYKPPSYGRNQKVSNVSRKKPNYNDYEEPVERSKPRNQRPPVYQEPIVERNKPRNPRQPVYQEPVVQRKNMRNNQRQPKPTYEQQYDYGNKKSYGGVRQSNNNVRKSNQPSYQYDQYESNPIEDKPIKELNRENKAEIVEYDPSQFRECRAGCGRKFNPDSIKKHEANCKKVFQKKRKEFNAQQHRMVERDQVKLMKKGQVIEKKMEQKKANEKIPKWKAESLALRVGIKNSGSSNYVPTKEEKKMMDQANSENTIRCKFCGRTFNEQAGKRHVVFCQTQAKKAAFKGKR